MDSLKHKKEQNYRLAYYLANQLLQRKTITSSEFERIRKSFLKNTNRRSASFGKEILMSNERTIHRIAPAPKGLVEQGKTPTVLRVAAYARVSTDSEDQLASSAAQVDYYTQYIQSRENWALAGIYLDEGISGTSTKKREGFTRMVQDALDGKIDLIITKSISCFARNTVDTLTTIRKLLIPFMLMVLPLSSPAFFAAEGLRLLLRRLMQQLATLFAGHAIYRTIFGINIACAGISELRV